MFKGYVEKHHIIPKALGGSNGSDNIARLTAREHFVCHLLLAKIHGGKMIHAAHRLSCDGKHGSRKYEWLSKERAKLVSIQHSGKIVSKETRENMSIAQKGLTRSEETKRRISEVKKGKVSNRKGCILSAETRKKLSVSHSGHVHSEEHKKRISIAMKGKNIGNAHLRWHKGVALQDCKICNNIECLKEP